MAAPAQPAPQAPEPPKKGVGGFLREHIDWKISIVAIVGAIWVLVKQQIPINLPPQVSGAVPVQLTHNGQAINRANVLQVSVINTGSKPLGEAGSWKLVLKTRDGSKLV